MRRTKADAEETRREIICAAERVFFAKGVPGATFEEIAAEAGVTRGAIYGHFQNKVDLFLALYDSVPLPEEDMFGPEIGQEDLQTLELIEITTSEWITSLSTDLQRQRIYTILLRCDFSQGLEPVLARQMEMDDHHSLALKIAFEKAAQADELNPVWTPDVAANTLYWALKGLCSEWLLWGRRFDLAEQGRRSISSLMMSFRHNCPSGGDRFSPADK